MKNLLKYLLVLFPLWGLTSYAQDTTNNAQSKQKDTYLPKGNEDFASKNYADAEANYRISQAKFTKKAASSYNLGTAIYRENQAGEAKYQFARAIKDAKTKTDKHMAFHNLGNSLMKEKDYTNAVEAYKNALRNNPSDEQTRYNYALAKKLLKDNPPPQKQDKDKNKDKEKDKDKNKDQNKDDKEKDKNQDNKDGKNKQDKDKGDEDKPQPSGASKQRIQNLLDAVNNEEKKVQEKVNAKKVQANPVKPEKDW